MEEYLVLEHAYSYGISLSKARRFTDEEKERYAEWFRDCGFVTVGDSIALPHIRSGECPKRPADGMFRGCSNRAWIVTQEEWDTYVALNEAREKDIADAEAAEKAAYEQKKAEYEDAKAKRVARLDSWEIADRVITDEGGKTHEYTHTITLNGKTYVFKERNVFDFGIVINPAYTIAPGHDSGISTREGDALWWMDLDQNGGGWLLIRAMEPDEAYCYETVRDFGCFVGKSIRM